MDEEEAFDDEDDDEVYEAGSIAGNSLPVKTAYFSLKTSMSCLISSNLHFSRLRAVWLSERSRIPSAIFCCFSSFSRNPFAWPLTPLATFTCVSEISLRCFSFKGYCNITY